MYTVVGLSRQNGTLKLRFANDFVTRNKVLHRNGHKDINLEVIKDEKGNILSMTKEAAVAWLSTKGGFFATVEAQSVFADYQSKNVKQTKGKELDVEVEFETAEAKAKRERDAARKREARAAAKTAELA